MPLTADSVLTTAQKKIYYILAVQPCRQMSGCCAVGSAPALGAGGREFESRHSVLQTHVDSIRVNVRFYFAGKLDGKNPNVCKNCAHCKTVFQKQSSLFLFPPLLRD